jgi:hypothetical protein
MKTYNQRVSEIKTVADIDKQLRLAKQAAMQLKRESKNDRITLAEKIAFGKQAQEAERVLRQLRQNCWDLEGQLPTPKGVGL